MSFISVGFYKLTAPARVEVKCREEVTRLWGRELESGGDGETETG